MNINSNVNALNSITDVNPAGNQTGSSPNGKPAQSHGQTVDRATLSTAGTGISQVSADADVRWEKVAAMQQALANGTYNVPASEVASSMVDAMLGKRS